MIKKYSTVLILIIISVLSTCLFLYKLTSSPPCLNADEVTNAYDAYSILTTGKDQYGTFLPLRFKSFGDYKLPLLTYMSVPFIRVFGLTEEAIRLVNLPFVFFFPFVLYFLAFELFNKKSVAITAAVLSGFSPGLQLLGRQAHEGYMTTFFLTLLLLFFVRLSKKENFKNYLYFFVTLLISLFGYHFSRLWAGFYFLGFLFLIFKKHIKIIGVVVFLLVFVLFGVTDVIYSPTRIKNLLFFNHVGLSLKINELRGNGGSRLLYNKLTIGGLDLVNQHLKYFSPQFLSISGDENARFGFPGISPITFIEYLLIFVGLHYLFKNKEKWRYLILLALLFAPLSASLSWAGLSITRSIFIFIPVILITSYGFISLARLNNFGAILLVIGYMILNFYSWDFYFNQYPKRAVVTRAWQCGYRELTDYVKSNYNNFDKFYITRKNGQPYIYLLFYLKYLPSDYQKQAVLTPPDEYGFGQIKEFDKFYFELPPTKDINKSAIIGYPDDFEEIEKPYLKEIKVGSETMFMIKEIK